MLVGTATNQNLSTTTLKKTPAQKKLQKYWALNLTQTTIQTPLNDKHILMPQIKSLKQATATTGTIRHVSPRKKILIRMQI